MLYYIIRISCGKIVESCEKGWGMKYLGYILFFLALIPVIYVPWKSLNTNDLFSGEQTAISLAWQGAYLFCLIGLIYAGITALFPSSKSAEGVAGLLGFIVTASTMHVLKGMELDRKKLHELERDKAAGTPKSNKH